MYKYNYFSSIFVETFNILLSRSLEIHTGDLRIFRYTRYMLQSVRNGWVSSKKRRSKRRERKDTKEMRAREPWRDAMENE